MGLLFTLLWYLPKLEIETADGCKDNFDQPFLQFNAKKKIYVRRSSRLEFNDES